MNKSSKGSMNTERVYKMLFGRVYPLYVQKAEKKGRTKEEADKLIDELAKGKAMEKILRK